MKIRGTKKIGMPGLPNPMLHFLVLAGLACCSTHFIILAAGNVELRALMDIKSSLDPKNKCLSSWDANGDPCDGKFVGVFCNEHRKVANISLQEKGLTGKLTPAMAKLKCLSGLYLHYNSLTGEVPVEIVQLTELTDLYLNFNNLTGPIPSDIGKMASLQVLQLSDNQLTGSIPFALGSLSNLNLLALENNRLTGKIPPSLGNLRSLKWLHLGFNQLSGQIPDSLGNVNNSLQVLDVQHNNLSGVIPQGLKWANIAFIFQNNGDLCGASFPPLRPCTALDKDTNLYPTADGLVSPTSKPQSAAFNLTCNHKTCSRRRPSKLPKIGLVLGLTASIVGLGAAASAAFLRHRRQKQRLRNASSDALDEDRLASMDRTKDGNEHSTTSHDRFSGVWDQSGIGPDSSCSFDGGSHSGSRFNLEEVESATQHFSEVNLLGRSKFCGVYRGILKDGSVVAVKCIGRTSCRSEEEEFLRGLSLLSSLKHENLVELKGFCRSKARGECFLIYDFATGGTLSSYLNGGTGGVLDWKTRVSIIRGIAKGIQYLHSSDETKPPIIHQNISVEKVLLGHNQRPLIMDSGVPRLLADDVVYSGLKASAALGYMAPEYVTTGRFTEKSDTYAYGVIVLQLLCGTTKLPGSARSAAEAGRLEEFLDPRLHGDYVESEARVFTRVALNCTSEDLERRWSMAAVVRELRSEGSSRNLLAR